MAEPPPCRTWAPCRPCRAGAPLTFARQVVKSDGRFPGTFKFRGGLGCLVGNGTFPHLRLCSSVEEESGYGYEPFRVLMH